MSYLILLVSIFCLSGCTPWLSSDNQNLQQIKIYESAQDVPRGYKIIGKAHTKNYQTVVVKEQSEQAVRHNLRKQAAAMGGNGVINICTNSEQTMGDVVVFDSTQ